MAPTLGRPLSGGAANLTLGLIRPGTEYGGRLNQLDVRVATDILLARFFRLSAQFDVNGL